MTRLMPDRVARQVNGPVASARSSIPRDWRMNTSSCCQVLRASLPVSATILAPCSLTAETSARWSWIRLSRVITSQPRFATSGIQTRSGVAGSETGQGTDAEFIFALPLVGRSCANAGLPRPYANFQANVGQGWEHPSLLSGQALVKPSRSHTYKFALSGAGQPVSFRLIDTDTRDDYGSFRIYLRTAAAADCSGHRYQAFGLTRMACLTATANGPVPPTSARRPEAPRYRSDACGQGTPQL
jgi:hypothetical protein